MTILFNRNIQNLFMVTGIHRASSAYIGDNPARSTWAITVLSGTQPSASTITSTWTNYNTTYLAHWQNVILSTEYQDSVSVTPGLILYNTPGAIAANASGTSTWAILWPTNPAESAIKGTTLPSTQFIVVPASDTSGTGVVRFLSSAFTAASTYTITDIAMTAAGGIA